MYPPVPRPLPESPTPVTDGNRWDDALGRYSTIYCASTPEAAYGETITRYRERPGLMDRMAAYLEGDPDQEYDFEIPPGEIPADYFASRVLGHAPIDPDTYFVDVDHPDTHALLSNSLPELVLGQGLEGYDRGVLMGPDRRITRNVARHIYELALAESEIQVGGLRYESRYFGDWECWALWEPSPIREAAADPPLDVSPSDIDLRKAADVLSVRLP